MIMCYPRYIYTHSKVSICIYVNHHPSYYGGKLSGSGERYFTCVWTVLWVVNVRNEVVLFFFLSIIANN